MKRPEISTNKEQRMLLKELGFNQTWTFKAEFQCVGYKTRKYLKHQLKTIYEPTLCLTNVKCNGIKVANHIWMNYSKRFVALGQLYPGDVIQFDGRVSTYTKGYRDNTIIDYTISMPSRIELVKKTSPKSGLKLPDVSTTDGKNALVGYIMKKNQEFYRKNGRKYDAYYVHQYERWSKNYYKNLKRELELATN